MIKIKKISVCVEIDKVVWKLIKKKCIDKGFKYSYYVEKLLKDDLEFD